jgi:glycerol kinase
VDGLGILQNAAQSEDVAGSVRDAGGVTFVPALGGLGTPLWDHGARGCLIGISGSTSRAEVVRAVLEGVAHRARDLVEAIEDDSGTPIVELGVDGGMSTNRLFVQLVANALGRPVLHSRVTEATTLGAAMLGGVATGRWSSLREAASVVPEPDRIEPTGTLDRERWLDARERSLRTVPALSMLSF